MGTIILFILSIFCFKNEKPVLKAFHLLGYAQGTTYHITYYARDSVITIKQTDSILKILDNSLSIYKPNSLISQFNNSDKGITMDKHLKFVVKKSFRIFKETQGGFDITVNPLVNAWGFGPQKISSFPDSALIKSILPCVGSQKLNMEGMSLKKDVSCLKIDVNGIAQGYSVDVLAKFLESKKIKTYLVEIGGEIRIKGKKPNNELMKIGIESPNAKGGLDISEKIIRIKKGAVTTSGNYRKFALYGKTKISHLIDPKTGYPVQNEMISVTIIAKDAITADGYDNALMNMGLDKSFSLLKSHKGLEAYFIYHKPDGSVADTATAGFYKYVSKTKNN
ncbi:MAG TPA: FAD:protein FMN transferase [Sphingobacteriaceae bacterium]|nr:FAD:protein FMN transferase [Sphingobacteriaceae bacterium]